MRNEEDKPKDIADFSVAANATRSFVEVKFVHSGGLASDVRIYFAQIEGSSVVAGDSGMPLGDLERDVRTTLFNYEEIDSTTVNSDYVVGVNLKETFAIFITWRPVVNENRLRATGLELGESKNGVVAMGPVLTSEEAMEYMTNTGMAQQADFSVPSASKDLEEAFFTDLSVAGFRGFAEKRVLRFAKPTGSDGSGLTIIVGANNSGKSTFLEALQVIARARQAVELSFPQPRRHRDADAVAIELTRSDSRRLGVRSTRPGGSQASATWSPESAGPDKFDLHITPSRRQFSPYFGNSGISDRDWGLMDQEFSRTQLREQFVGRLRKVDRDDEAREVFDKLLEEIVGSPMKWTIDEIATGQQFLKLTESDGAWHTSEGLGDGLVSLLFIVDALYDSAPGCLIAIDEPELSLHPQLVRRLGRVLSRYAADRQIVIATHSPLLVDWADVANGASVARVYKSNGRSEIAQASTGILCKVARLTDSRNLKNPHTVGTIAREALFLEDGVILTEGQDDVAYLPRVLDDLELPHADNIYGWGSGGVGNIPILAQLFVELGFTKIGAILDDDNQTGTLAAVGKLKAMAPEVLVRQIPAPDIRYKQRVVSRSEVVGLLDRDNTHVRTELREAAKSALKDVLDHVSALSASE